MEFKSGRRRPEGLGAGIDDHVDVAGVEVGSEPCAQFENAFSTGHAWTGQVTRHKPASVLVAMTKDYGV
jgi:hypothetical protein